MVPSSETTGDDRGIATDRTAARVAKGDDGGQAPDGYREPGRRKVITLDALDSVIAANVMIWTGLQRSPEPGRAGSLLLPGSHGQQIAAAGWGHPQSPVNGVFPC
jgi:hypothetical protein